MLFRTHLLFALFLSIIFWKINLFQNKVFLFVLIIAAIFSDIDFPKSRIGKKTGILSNVINLFFGHRGFFHSMTFLIIFSVILLFLKISFSIILLFFIGYLSHLFLDSLTLEGIYPFWPLKLRIRGFIKTGGLLENLFFLTIFFILIFLFLKFFF